MKVGEWITIFEALEAQGATEECELKFFSEAGVPYEIKRINSLPDIQKEIVKDKKGKEHNLFKIRIT